MPDLREGANSPTENGVVTGRVNQGMLAGTAVLRAPGLPGVKREARIIDRVSDLSPPSSGNTLHLKTTFAYVPLDGVLTRTMPLTLIPAQAARIQDARPPGAAPLLNQRPARVQRTVSCRAAAAKSSVNASKSGSIRR
jgi:hypothetical protein